MEGDQNKSFGKNNVEIEVLLDIRSSDLTLSQVIMMMEDYRTANPDRVVWMDGDLYAIVAADREAMA